MKELLNVTAREYLNRRIRSLKDEELNELGNALCYIAYVGKMPDMKTLAHFTGTSQRKFTKDILGIINEIFYNELFNKASDNYLWVDKPEREEFLIAMAAGLVAYGYWVETPEEPEERLVARETIAQVAPATIVRKSSEFRGYLAVIEYLWYSISHDDMSPKAWMKQRYGAKSKIKQYIDAYLEIFAKTAYPTIEDGGTHAVLTELKLKAIKNWEDCREGRHPD